MTFRHKKTHTPPLLLTLLAAVAAASLLLAIGCSETKSGDLAAIAGENTDSLNLRAMRHFDNGCADSAVILLSYITERYETQGGPAGKGVTPKQALKAFINLGYIFSNGITDYAKAYDCEHRALEIYNEAVGRDSTFRLYLPYIYLNLGVTLLSYEESSLDTDSLPQENEKYIREAFTVGARQKEWRPTLIAFQNLCNILQKRNDTTGLRRVIDTYERLQIPEDEELSTFTDGITTFFKAYLDGDYRRARSVAAEMCPEMEPSPMGDNLAYISRWLQAEALDAAGDPATAGDTLLALASDIERHGSSNARMWICKILAARYEQSDPEKSRAWQLAFFKAREQMEKATAGTSGIGYLNDLRKTRNSFLDAKEQQTRTRHQMSIILIISSVLIIVLVGIILWQRQSRHYRRTIVRKQLMLIRSKAAENTSSPDPKEEADEERGDDGGHDATAGTIKDELLKRVGEVFADRKTVLNPEFSMSTLCTMVESNPTYVSRAIKTIYGKSLSALVNEIRIEEACRLLADEGSDMFTVEGVAAQVGFKSRSNFTAVFKKNTGLSPAEFKKASREV